MKYLKIKDHAQYVKDPNTGAILLNDKTKHNEYLNKRKSVDEINTIKHQVETLTSDMGEIKKLLQAILAAKTLDQ